MKWAIRIRYLESKYTGDGKWHQHTTKWYDDSVKAWEESDKFQVTHHGIDESSCSLIHKEK